MPFITGCIFPCNTTATKPNQNKRRQRKQENGNKKEQEKNGANAKCSSDSKWNTNDLQKIQHIIHHQDTHKQFLDFELNSNGNCVFQIIPDSITSVRPQNFCFRTAQTVYRIQFDQFENVTILALLDDEHTFFSPSFALTLWYIFRLSTCLSKQFL